MERYGRLGIRHQAKSLASDFAWWRNESYTELMARRRYLDAQLRQDLGKKMVFVAGPRQVGKTTLSLALLRTLT